MEAVVTHQTSRLKSTGVCGVQQKQACQSIARQSAKCPIVGSFYRITAVATQLLQAGNLAQSIRHSVIQARTHCDRQLPVTQDADHRRSSIQKLRLHASNSVLV
ncbi:TPA: hypothetical protein ACH3X3_15306 [Trebouxia sp. C0006]